jgi:hypothetical protein
MLVARGYLGLQLCLKTFKNLGSDGFLNGKRMERGQPFEDDMDILGGWQLWLENSLNQWPFQDPRLEVPTIYKAYFSGLNFREYPHKIWPEIWY